MKILFVDHTFHKKTKSSNFFIEILSLISGASIDIEYIHPDTDRRIVALDRPRKHDLVVVWQLDFLAPVFLAAGYPTVVVPMYDGSAAMPYEHWLAMADASFINFSRTLHERVCAVGARSFLVRYYKTPQPESKLPEFEDLRAILWMRRPEDGVTPRFVESLIGANLASIHVHNAPDSGIPPNLQSSDLGTRHLIYTKSRWKQDSNPYLEAMAKANVFIAPRLSEGIGMTLAEALAHGLLVIAHDDAVHNEYICNWTNGILYSRSSGSFYIPKQQAKEMAYLGWKGAALGYEEWLDNLQALLRFVADTPAPRAIRPSLSAYELLAYWDAYALGINSYQRFLRDYFFDTRSVDQWRNIATPVKAMLRDLRESLFSLDEGTAFFGYSPNTPANKFGFADIDALSARVDALSVGFQLACAPVGIEIEAETLVIQCRLEQDTDADWLALIHVDGHLSSRAFLPRKAGVFELEAPFTRSHEPILFHISFIDLGASPLQAVEDIIPPPVRFFSCDIRGALR